MHKLAAVIRREFVERVRSKWFVIGTILGPLFMGLILVLPMMLAEQGGGNRTVIVLDASGEGFGERATAALGQLPRTSATRRAVPLEQIEDVATDLARQAGTSPLDGILLLTDNTVEGGRAEYRGANVTSMADMRDRDADRNARL